MAPCWLYCSFINSTTKTMKKIFALLMLLTITASANELFAQGCVAIRSTGGFCTVGGEHHSDTSAQWLLNINNRYYKSFKHYIGETYQKQRAVLGNEVIIHAYTGDLAIFHVLNPRWSLMLDL